MKYACEHRLTIDCDMQTLREIDKELKNTILPKCTPNERKPYAVLGDYLLSGEAESLAQEIALLAGRYPKAAFSLQCETADGQYSETVYLHGCIACTITGRIERFRNKAAGNESSAAPSDADQLLPENSGCIRFREYLRGALVTKLDACAEVQPKG
jgi:hypothetical protein